MKTRILIYIFLFVVFGSCQEKTESNWFAGMWKLVKCTGKQNDGTISFPYGENPVGQLFYDSKGNMMVEIMSTGIKKFAGDNLLQGTAEEILPAYKGLMAYNGTYKILPDSDLIIHDIQSCSFPNWTGQKQRRFYEFKNDQLILRTPPIGTVQYELIWQKIE